jgi:predicted ATPase
MGSAAARAGDDVTAAANLRAALALWRGPALADVLTAPFAASAAAKLDEARLNAVEDLLDVLLRLGRFAEAVEASDAWTGADPLRERLRAGRMRALSAVGRQAEALAGYEETRRALAEELGVDPSPGLAAAHLAVLRGECAEGVASVPASSPTTRAATGSARSARPAHLRLSLTSFVGREGDLARVREMLATGRLVTLVGPGGAGKTRLAAELTARLPERVSGPAGLAVAASRFSSADGLAAERATTRLADEPSADVVAAELAPVGAGDEVPRAVLAALGISEPNPGLAGSSEMLTAHARRSTLDKIADAIGARRTLLLLDNCEHVIVAAARLADELLRRCPGLSILATSREPLTIAGEAVYPVPPLAVPEGTVVVSEATRFAAVRLFADRAVAVRPDFAVDGDNVEAVAAICRRLDGLPLAIELAAARVRSLSARQIADRLDDRFRLLTGGSRVGLARHRTLRAVVEWSWDLLDQAESVLARRFAVFAGGATLEAVEQVCSDDRLPVRDVLDALAGLVDKSLIERVGSATTRYRMLETIHEYSAERLREAGERERAELAHARYYRDVVEANAPQLIGADQIAALATITADIDNLMVAFHRARERADADLVVRLAAGLGPVWTLRGLHAAAATWLTDALAVKGDAPPIARALTLCFACVNLAASGRFAEVGPYAEELLDVVVEHQLAERHPLLALVEPALALKDGDNARVLALLDGVTARADPVARACALILRAHVYEEMSEPERGEVDIAEAIRVLRTTGDRWLLSLALSNQAQVCAQRGDYEAAAKHGAEGMALIEELGPFQGYQLLSAQNAIHVARTGDTEGARRQLLAMRDAPHSGLLGAIMVEAALGHVDLLRGELESASRHVLRALELYEPARDTMPPQMRVMLLVGLAQIEITAGELDTAAARLREAAVLSFNVDDLPVLGMVVMMRAWLTHRRGAAVRAAWLLGRAALIRGRLDLSDSLVRDFVTDLRDELGEARYQEAFERGRAGERQAAISEMRSDVSGESMP